MKHPRYRNRPGPPMNFAVGAMPCSRSRNKAAKFLFIACGRMRVPWRATFVKSRRTLAIWGVATAFGLTGLFVSGLAAKDDDHSKHFKFQEDSLVLSRSVYEGRSEEH